MQYKRIGDIAELINGYAFKSKNYVEQGIRVIRIANVQDGKIVDEQPCFYPEKNGEDIEKYILKKGDLLISLTGNVGRVGLLSESMLPAALNQRVGCIRLKDANIYMKYLFLYLRRKEFTQECIKASKGVAQLNLSTKWIENYKIPIPELVEQQRIVSKIEELFSSLDNAVETLNRTKEQLVVYRQSVLKELFGKLNGDKTVLGEVIVSKPRNGYSPQGVTYVTPYKNLTLTATTKGFFQEDCFKYIDIDIDDDSYLWVKHNDILIQRANTVEYVGISAIYKGDDNKYVYPDLMMKFHIKNGIDPSFILYQLKYSHAIGYYRKHATGTAGSMPKINQTTVMNTPIIMTSLDNQIKIVKELDSKYSLCDSIEEMVDKALVEAEALRQSILKAAFEGGLV